MKLPHQVKFIPPQEFPLADSGRPPRPKAMQYRTRDEEINADPNATPEMIGVDTTGWTEWDYDQFYGARKLYLARLAKT